ncbi:MAG: hypothetical protein IPM92_13865 [Saprospiraceae bacterium]|nr:hypothetical protein [Saprospiraceae bacterium]
MNLSRWTDINKKVLHPGDTAGIAKQLFQEGSALEIPIVEKGKCLGTISATTIQSYEDSMELNPEDYKKAVISTLEESVPGIWKKFMDNQCSTVVFEDAKEKFLGYTSVWDFVKIYKQVVGIGEFNCLLVLKMRKLDYVLSKLSSLAEETECYIINVFVISSADAEYIYVNLDLEGEQPEGFIQTLERHEIEVERFLCKTEKEDVLQERLDMLMSYLNV